MPDPSAFIGVGNKGRRRYAQREALAAHFREDDRVVSGVRRRQVSHRDRRVEARAETAGGDLADRLRRSRVRKKRRAFAYGRTSLRPEPNPAARGALLELFQDPIGARKSACTRAAVAAALLNGPFQRALDRRRRGIEVVATKTKP